jgi:CDP-glycerol glycerophosphotransferase (TagB/SpsB family)
MDSAILVTDFSSVFFDFAYMGKPEVYFQPDEKEYREYHYSKGYFDYYTDGFGPVFFDPMDTVEYLINLLCNNCEIEKQYLDRINSFFTIRDNHNCERTFQAICDLE